MHEENYPIGSLRVPSGGVDNSGVSGTGFQAWFDEWGFIPQGDAHFTAQLEKRGLELIHGDTPDGYRWPTLSEWTTLCFDQKNPHRFYPAFVQRQEDGEVFFTKTRIRSRVEFGGLEHEANVLRNLPEGVLAPKVIDYIPEGKEQLEMLLMTAIRFSEGHALPARDWQAAHVESVARQIKLLESVAMADVPSLSPVPVLEPKSLVSPVLGMLPAECRQVVEETLVSYEPYLESVFVHGDPLLRNIIVKQTGDCVLTDWERGGAGYRGQDAAIFLLDVWSNESARQSFLNAYLEGSSASERSNRLVWLRFGIVYDFLQWANWRVGAGGEPEEIRADISEKSRLFLPILSTLNE